MFDTSTSFQILSFLFVEYSSEVCLDEICLQLQASTLLCWKYVSDDELESFLKKWPITMFMSNDNNKNTLVSCVKFNPELANVLYSIFLSGNMKFSVCFSIV